MGVIAFRFHQFEHFLSNPFVHLPSSSAVECVCELLAGTDPTDASDLLKTTAATKQADDFKLDWTTKTGKLYRVDRAEDLVGGFVPVVSNIVGTGSIVTYTDPDTPSATNRFYRITLQE